MPWGAGIAYGNLSRQWAGVLLGNPRFQPTLKFLSHTVFRMTQNLIACGRKLSVGISDVLFVTPLTSVGGTWVILLRHIDLFNVETKERYAPSQLHVSSPKPLGSSIMSALQKIGMLCWH